MAFFGSAFASSKTVVSEIPHDAAASLRFGGGAIVLVLVLIARRGRPSFSWTDVRAAGMVGLIGVFAYNFFYFWGVSLAPAIDGSVIVPAISPVLTTLFCIATGRETSSAWRLIGLGFALAGSGVFFAGIGTMRGGVTSGHLTGALLFLDAAGCWAIYSVAARGALARIEPLRATTYATVVGAIMLTAIATPSFCRTEWTHVSFGVWLNVLFLSVGPTAIAYLFYFRRLRAVGPVTATLTMFAVPVFGATASFLFLGDRSPSCNLSERSS